MYHHASPNIGTSRCKIQFQILNNFTKVTRTLTCLLRDTGLKLRQFCGVVLTNNIPQIVQQPLNVSFWIYCSWLLNVETSFKRKMNAWSWKYCCLLFAMTSWSSETPTRLSHVTSLRLAPLLFACCCFFFSNKKDRAMHYHLNCWTTSYILYMYFCMLG